MPVMDVARQLGFASEDELQGRSASVVAKANVGCRAPRRYWNDAEQRRCVLSQPRRGLFFGTGVAGLDASSMTDPDGPHAARVLIGRKLTALEDSEQREDLIRQGHLL